MSIGERPVLKSAIGAALAVICGLVLWKSPLGDGWVNASYDYLFRFDSRPVTNNVVLLVLDNGAYAHFHQTRGEPWDRSLHAELLERLASDGCPLVVFDSIFRNPRDPVSDEALAAAMRKQGRVVLAADQNRVDHPDIEGAEPILPADIFLRASGANWGVAWTDGEENLVARRIWPFVWPAPYPSLPEKAAELAGAHLSTEPDEKWLRYYGQDGQWTRLGYQFALSQSPGFYRNKIVFIGNAPATTQPGDEKDEFRTPYTRWTGESSGGVDLIVTSFLNLMNNDWLRRPAWWMEGLVIVLAGVASGGGLCRLKSAMAWIVAAVSAIGIVVAGVSLSYYSNFWFPWLVIAGGQLPCALAFAVLAPKPRRVEERAMAPAEAQDALVAAIKERMKTVTEPVTAPDAPDYELFHPPFGEGAYGKVWLARNAIGEWQALKAVYQASFENKTDPYEREFQGITNYKPISDKHPGLLRVDFVSKKRDGYFYYVMELGDPLEAGWEKEPSSYKPCDLFSLRASSKGRRLSVRECLRIGISLAGTLDFLHQQGLTHRDIKPQNIIFVKGEPKLADVGLISEIRPPGEPRTFVGTPGYMPPQPEMPGTPQADIYSLGMVLYVLSTGRGASYFPEIATTLAGDDESEGFFPLNEIVLKACHPELGKRYTSAADLRSALEKAWEKLELVAAN